MIIQLRLYIGLLAVAMGIRLYPAYYHQFGRDIKVKYDI